LPAGDFWSNTFLAQCRDDQVGKTDGRGGGQVLVNNAGGLAKVARAYHVPVVDLPARFVRAMPDGPGSRIPGTRPEGLK
jgi:hypothetical protein